MAALASRSHSVLKQLKFLKGKVSKVTYVTSVPQGNKALRLSAIMLASIYTLQIEGYLSVAGCLLLYFLVAYVTRQ